ncbi:hypothetical protein [Pseudaminobacter salicylatoxidans]|uniref:hypothetical protein n=1 Tax=Pseudaminobacter salicylatoxidans TaxID=93369 RepID=UPI0002D66A20|nr:hypothetical protein [Pseudaminobacter salicylatoxidans]
MLILAFDQSIKRTGWCLAEANSRGKLIRETVKFGSFASAPREGMGTEEKCETFGREVKDLFDRERPDFVTFEAARDDIVAYPRKVNVKGKPTKTQSGDLFAKAKPETKMLPATVNAGQLILRDIQGQIRQACIERSLPWVKPSPKTWRAELFGEGYGNMETEKAKAHAKAYCRNIRVNVSNGDQAEAVCIAIWTGTCDEFRWHLDQTARDRAKRDAQARAA